MYDVGKKENRLSQGSIMSNSNNVPHDDTVHKAHFFELNVEYFSSYGKEPGTLLSASNTLDPF